MRESRQEHGDFAQLSRADRDALVVVVGGLDPTGGAGVVRDFLTARTLNARVRVVATAWTEQSAAGVSSVEPRDPKALEAALAAALSDRTAPIAVKIGMLPDGFASEAVQRALRKFEGPVVFDPVLGATSGGSLYRGDPAALLALGRVVTLFTPNALEAVRLTKGEVVETFELAGAERVGWELVTAGVPAVLVKGGHLDGPLAVDLLVRADGVERFEAARWPGPPVRGTGCALATAIAVGLARGLELTRAVGAAKAWLHQAIGGAVAVGTERHLG